MFNKVIDGFSVDCSIGIRSTYAILELEVCEASDLRVYFDNVVLKDGKASVYVDSAFGSVILYIPSDWRVLTKLEVSFGDATEHGRSNALSENTIELFGEVSFGDLKIKYI